MGISYNVKCNLCHSELEYGLIEKELIEHESIVWKSDMGYNILICKKCREKLFEDSFSPLFDELDCQIAQTMKLFYDKHMK